MKEYVPGQGSYKVEEAGSLTGIGTSYNVDNNWGTLVFERDDVKIPAGGIDIALSSRFNSDHLYSTVIPKISKSDGPVGLTSTPIPNSLVTLPGDQTNFYRIANGWSWKLPFVLLGVNAFKFSLGDGKIFDLLATITKEAWGLRGTGAGNHSWTEGYEVTYAPESGGYSLVTIVIPEIQVTIVARVLRNGTDPYDFTPQNDSNLKVYLADGRVITFNANGMISTLSDPAGKNWLTFSYETDVLGGNTYDSTSRKTFEIARSDYDDCSVGDLVIIGDEIKVIFSKNGTDANGGWISTSSNYDVYIPNHAQGYSAYKILKGKLQKITHTDSRAVKFYYFPESGNNCIAILLSADPTMDNFVAGDQFLGYYTIGPTNQLVKYQTCSDAGHASKTGGFFTDLAANPSAYFGILQTVTYQYNLTSNPSPGTDQIIVTNNVGAPTIYYFQKGGFCSHSWNNAYFHRGSCRRGGTLTTMIIERPDFYISASNYNYICINRINDNAFYQASKDNYQKDENAADFQEENEFSTKMFVAGEALAAVQTAMSVFMNPVGAAMGAAQMAMSAMQYEHTQAKYAKDAAIARNAPNVSQWALVSSVTSPNRLTLGGSGLSEYPRQNDVYAVLQLSGTFDKTAKISKTSRNSTRVYVDYTSSPNFAEGDYVFLRSEMQVISDTGSEDFGVGGSQKWIEVETAFQFIPDENEQVLFVYKNGGKLPAATTYYAYYLNKPKVVRIEIKDEAKTDQKFWKRIDYEYSYEVQGTSLVDDFYGGGFEQNNIEGPYNKSFESSDISLKGIVITTGVSNIDTDKDLTREAYTFAYDVKGCLKGQDSILKMRLDESGINWLFVNKTINQIGRPCFNAGYYGVMTSFYYEGGNAELSDGGAFWRKRTDYRYDAYGRVIKTKIMSSSLEGRKNKSSWVQYVGSQATIDDLDPLDVFGKNYLSGDYQQVLASKHALGLVGATLEEVDAYGTVKLVINGFEVSTMDLLLTDTLVESSLSSYSSILSTNKPNFKGVYGGTVETDPTKIWWNLGSGDDNDWSTGHFGFDDVTSHAITRYEYDPTTNNLIRITKPRGNAFNLSYGSGWKISYVTVDYKTLDLNIGGTTQYVVNAYDYDIRGRLTSKTVRFKSDYLANDANLMNYGISSPKTVTQYTYDGMSRLTTKAIGDGTTQTLVLKLQYFDSGDASWQNPLMISTDYLGFRKKSYYDSRYRLVYSRKYKPNQNIGGDLSYSPSLEVAISSERNIYDAGLEMIVQNIIFSDPDESANHMIITRKSYDSIGRLLRVEQKNTDSEYQGDSVFRTLKEITYDETMNAVVTNQYLDDSSGNYIKSRVENDWLGRGPVREISWTGLNGLGVQRIVVNHYRHDGKVIRKDMPNKDFHLYNYDNTGKLEMVIYPDGTRATIMYDVNSNVVQIIDRRSVSTTMEYNHSDMQINKSTIDISRGDTSIATTYTQFGVASVVKSENGAEIVENDYWYHWSGGVLKQQQKVDGHTMEIDSTFDAAGNKISITPIGSGSSPWTNTFNILSQFHATSPDTDHFNRTAIEDNSTGENVVTHEPDFLELSAKIKYGDYAAVVSSLSFSYDKFLRGITFKSSEATPFLDVALARDLMGHVVGHTEPALSPVPAIENSYVYDGMGRLLSGEGSSETYDELSNMVTQGAEIYTYQDPNSATGDQMRLATFNNGTLYSYNYDAEPPPTKVGGFCARRLKPTGAAITALL